MGSCKQLLPLNGKPVIIHCLEAMINAEISDIIVVINSAEDVIIDAISGFPVTIARNEDPESDMAGSVRTGLRRIANSTTGVLVSLADNPLISSTTYSLIRECHEIAPDEIIIPVYKGKRGHPTLFPSELMDQMVKPLTLRDLLRLHSERILPVPVPDIGVTLDMDNMEDYERVQGILSSLNASKLPGTPHYPPINSLDVSL